MTLLNYYPEKVPLKEWIHLISDFLMGRTVACGPDLFVVIGVERENETLVIHVQPAEGTRAIPLDGGRFMGFGVEVRFHR